MFDVEIDKVGMGSYVASIDGELIGFHRIRRYSPTVCLYRVATLMSDERTIDFDMGTYKLGNRPSKRDVNAMLENYREELLLASIE